MFRINISVSIYVARGFQLSIPCLTLSLLVDPALSSHPHYAIKCGAKEDLYCVGQPMPGGLHPAGLGLGLPT